MLGRYPGVVGRDGYASPRAGYNIPPMSSNISVAWTLTDPRNAQLIEDPEYVKAVFRSYIQVKRARGRTPAEISEKLNTLEDQLPGYIVQWKQIRRECGLPASRTLPRWEARHITPLLPEGPTRITSSSTAALSPTSPRPAGARRASTSARTPRRSSHSAVPSNNEPEPIPPQLRRPPNPEDEPPPPPYTRDDADPESTQILEQRLAAEAEANRTVPVEPSPSTPRRSTETRHRSSSLRTPSTPQQTTPAATQRFAPPPGPPPRRGSRVATPISSRPDTPPNDPELRRVWEESQFEEAKRASLAAQREQEELEEAMRLSLAETTTQPQASSSRIADQPSGSGSRPTIATVWEDGVDEDDVANSRRISSYHTTTLGNLDLPSRQRRTVSDANLRHDELANSATEALGSLSITDGWQDGPRSSPPASSRVLQSNNPFLSRAERQQAASQLPAADLLGQGPEESPAMPTATLLSPSRPLPRVSSLRVNDSPESSQRQEQGFAPPPGPPPAHLRVQTTLPPGAASPDQDRPPESYQNFGAASEAPPLPPRKDNAALNTPSVMVIPPNSSRADGIPPPQSALQGDEPGLDLLKEYQAVFLVNDSATMAGETWAQTQRALTGVTEIVAQHSEMGVDVHFLNSKRAGRELRTSEDIEDLFAGLQPKGTAPTGVRADAILRDYLNRLEASAEHGYGENAIPAMNLIIITDGASSRSSSARLPHSTSDSSLSRNMSPNQASAGDLESVIVAAARRLDKGDILLSQLGIQIMQVGGDSETREAMQHLDDGLQSAFGVRDMVDTVVCSPEELSAELVIQALLGGINRRLNRHSVP